MDSSSFIMKFDNIVLVSTNDMYLPTASSKVGKNNHRKAFFRKSSELVRFQKEMDNRLMKYQDELNEYINYNKSNIKHLGFKLSIYIYMDDLLYKQKSKSDDLRPYDSSNYIKALEDSIASFININDKYNIDVRVRKFLNTKNKGWNVSVKLDAIDYINYCNIKE